MGDAQRLRDVGVAMKPGQAVLAPGERSNKPRAVEQPGRIKMPPVSRDFVKRGQHIAHRSKFILRIAASIGSEQLLNLVFTERGESLFNILRHLH